MNTFTIPNTLFLPKQCLFHQRNDIFSILHLVIDPVPYNPLMQPNCISIRTRYEKNSVISNGYLLICFDRRNITKQGSEYCCDEIFDQIGVYTNFLSSSELIVSNYMILVYLRRETTFVTLCLFPWTFTPFRMAPTCNGESQYGIYSPR